ncbi:MAG: hypothetical protein Q9220_000159 [cf. Caloplaca sp. 1 TL-2023]
MTARGKQVKIQTLSLENEIFVYNRQILSPSAHASLSSSLPTTSTPEPYKPQPAPDGPRSKTSLEAWQKLFEERSSWATELRNNCSVTSKQVGQLEEEAGIIQRSAAIAVENVKQHIGNLRPKFEDSTVWADNVLEDQTLLLEQWEDLVGKYPSIPAIKALCACVSENLVVLQKVEGESSSRSESSLHAFLDIPQLTRASNTGRVTSQRFRARASELKIAFTDVEQKANTIVENFSRYADSNDSASKEQAEHLREEIEVIAKKIKADRDFVLGLSHTPNSLSQTTRIALLHTRSFIPTLLQTANELDQLLRKVVDRKNDAQVSGVQYLQNISTVESRIGLVHAKLAKLDTDLEDGQAFETLRAVARLPSVYGMLLIECIRRLEWIEKITMDSSTLVEEVATFKEEEIKRRKKWVKDMEGAVDLGPLDEMSFGIDINLQSEKEHWPKLTRDDFRTYISTLRELHGFDNIIKEIEAVFATLDAPTKQQSRRAKAFKNGSIHDTAFGRNSLLLRGDDETLHALKTDKSRLEDKLKGSESRIRKLEDLLHRQSQISRPSSSGNPFSVQPPISERYNSSPLPGFNASLAKPQDTISRRSSTSSRRVSTHVEPDEKSQGKRIASLEAELFAEKTQSANLQKDAAAKLATEDGLRVQVQEAISTKEDLLGNFEAQQREFDDERRLLEDENLKLKIRLEEAEDELDRVLGSRDHEARAHALEEEIHRIRQEAVHDVRSVREEKDSLRNEYEILQDMNNKLQGQYTELQSQSDQHYAELIDRKDHEEDHRVTLHSALSHIEPESILPDDFRKSIRSVDAAMRRQKSNFDDLKQLLETTRAQNEEARSTLAQRDVDVQDLNDRLANEEMEGLKSREILAEHREVMNRTKMDFDRERTEHGQVRDKHQSAEERATSLVAKIQTLQEQLQDSQAQSSERLATRGKRAEEITRTLCTYVYRLEKLLEQIGYTVSRQSGSPMIVTKTPKPPGSTSTVLTSSGPLPSNLHSSDLELPHLDPTWSSSTDPSSESALFSALTSSLSTFSLDTFHDAVLKRLREADHQTRKWQREARAYRTKSHTLASESNAKIAFRSFKEGDLALFLPTRNQKTRPWAAFNVGAPHYFLREREGHRLRDRDWLVARIVGVEERVVDLSKSVTNSGLDDARAVVDDDENPFELSDGLRWYLLDATEEKPGAPINVGLGKATVASASVDARGSSIRSSERREGDRGGKGEGGEETKKLLTRSLDSRRSSTGSKKSKEVPVVAGGVSEGNGAVVEGLAGGKDGADGAAGPAAAANDDDRPKEEAGKAGENGQVVAGNTEEVCKDLLWGP